MSSSKTALASNTTTSLLGLPTEVRHEIYHYLLWLPHLVVVSDNPAYSRNQSIMTPLLATCQKLRKELQEFFWTGSLRIDWEEKHWKNRLASQNDVERIWYCDEIPSLRTLGLCNANTTTVVLEFSPGTASVLSPPLKIKDWRDICATLGGGEFFRTIWQRKGRANHITLTEEMKLELLEKKEPRIRTYLEKWKDEDCYDWWDEEGGRGIWHVESSKGLVRLT